MNMAKQKVRLMLDLLIDTDAWYAAYGIDPLFDDAQDVRAYVAAHMQNSAAWDEGGIVSAAVR
jgi:hypothetical protein